MGKGGNSKKRGVGGSRGGLGGQIGAEEGGKRRGYHRVW